MGAFGTDRFLSVANNSDLAESGGGHNQKGVDFQRYWAVLRMLDLEQAATPDFLFIFEAVQDIAQLDSETSPTNVQVFQVKKKDRTEWTWNSLTGLPDITAKKPKLEKTHIKASPLGKLFLSVAGFENFPSTGRFISNAGCNIALAEGGNAATSLPCDLNKLSSAHVSLLKKGFGLILDDGVPVPDLSRFHLERTDLPVLSIDKHVIGVAFTFLQSRSPRHSAQAKALVEALVSKISPLGRKTDKCATFDELRKERGYSRAEFVNALAALEEVPDILAVLDNWLQQLAQEGLDFVSTTSIRLAATAIFRRELIGNISQRDVQLRESIDLFFCRVQITNKLRPLLDCAFEQLGADYSDYRKSELLANVLIRGIHRCVALT